MICSTRESKGLLVKPIWASAIFLGFLCCGFVAYVGQTAGQLPVQVASHFGGGGQPNGWMSRSGYTNFMILFGLGLPAFTVAVGYLTRFVPTSMVNIPHGNYWLAPERRPETSAFLLNHCVWLACLEVGFVAGMHYLTILANGSVPVRMPMGALVTVLAVFLAGLVIWIFSLVAHFRKPA